MQRSGGKDMYVGYVKMERRNLKYVIAECEQK